MGIADTYEHGQHNVICDRCGFKYKAKHLRKEWNGLRTCHGSGTNGCWEPRHQQDFVRGQADRQKPEWTRPEPTPTFIMPDGGTEFSGDVTGNEGSDDG
ncbi:MAG: hypothetical protein Tp118SUR00d2C21406231_6 [Prokaryotic dsDNA virus sp.]|nr:MAG: hypothetical protein Tp125DCM00d2C40298531_25 [Prokaryotic dsDNA virus sp.]QDP53126.1 MAG: hypothetical protein Tp118SUR00d2C21406231_6 [Prokaryotic dsDNA virus sp.]|tara:strand:+ start:3550 stop:3846 length:297 start_codon:yes stop_codon:yes gene_type:complete